MNSQSEKAQEHNRLRGKSDQYYTDLANELWPCNSFSESRAIEEGKTAYHVDGITLEAVSAHNEQMLNETPKN